MSTSGVTEHRFGTVALVGRPNVGKSTLLNALVGAKLTIVTPKPQTTRNRIVGIRNLPAAQVAFLDTPGIHTPRTPLTRRMVDVARQARAEADTIVVVVDASDGIRAGDERILAESTAAGPVLVAVNKVDRVPKPQLLPLLSQLSRLVPERPLVPVSARQGTQVDVLLDEIVASLPLGPPHFPADVYTTATERFLVQEIVREQVFLATREEVPYGTAVVVESFAADEARNLTEIHATFLVERESHRGIVIGAQGTMLTEIGSRARVAIEELLGTRVHLALFVRVEPDWARRRDRLAELEL
jgi:GTP-binding protein Era